VDRAELSAALGVGYQNMVWLEVIQGGFLLFNKKGPRRETKWEATHVFCPVHRM
jgi:hypothetical protein